MIPHHLRFLVVSVIVFFGLLTVSFSQTNRPALFAKISEQMRAIICDKSSSEGDLLEAVAHLGRVTEPSSFWTKIANDASYRLAHRRLAVFALFRRHCFADTAKSLGAKLKPAHWLRDEDITQCGSDVHFGAMPIIGLNAANSVFEIKVLNGASVYVCVAGRMSRDDFSRSLRNIPVDWSKVGSDGVILQCAFADEYENWLRNFRQTATQGENDREDK